MSNDRSHTWEEILNRKVKIVHSQIAALQKWAAEAGCGAELLEELCRPHYQLLEDIYQNEYPLARALEVSDLLIKIEGSAVSVENPRLSLIATIFGDVRKQVGNVAKSLAGLLDKSRNIPKEMDLGLAAYARGSLILGFTLTPPDEDAKGQKNLLGSEDPFYKAAKSAIKTIGLVTQRLSEKDVNADVSDIVPDPVVRDTVLTAIERLAPTGQKGIDSVTIGGKDFQELSLGSLTPEFKKGLKERLRRPISEKFGMYRGRIREIDLDERHFELRHLIDNTIGVIRCKYDEKFDEDAPEWLDKKVQVEGRVEFDVKKERPKLLEVIDIELIG